MALDANVKLMHICPPTDTEGGSAAPAAGDSSVAKTFHAIEPLVNEDMVGSMKAVYSFDLTGGFNYYIVHYKI